MPNPGLTDEQCIEAINAYREHGGHNAAARALDMDRMTFKNRYQKAVARGFDGSLPETLPPGYNLAGTSRYYKLDDGGIWVKTRFNQEEENLIDAIKETLADITPAKPVKAPAKYNEDLLTVFPVVDHHIGLYAWAKETRDANYDLDSAVASLRDSVSHLVSKSPKSDTAVIIGLGDLIHSDTEDNRTRRSGNPLDVDGRYAKIQMAAVMVLRDCIDIALKRHRDVAVRLLKGNHDDHAAIMLAIALAQFYANEPRVTVDLDPSLFWIFEWGRVMLGATHGHMAKEKDIPGVMANVEREMWGRSEYRYAYMGHLHHKRVLETNGVIVETFQTLAAKDEWAAGKGYISGRSMTSITYHKEDGEIERRTINIPRPRIE